MKQTLSQALGGFAAGLEWRRIAPEVRERTKLLIVDAIGVAFASTRFDFALRDAVRLNGILVHGLDYDDTYLPLLDVERLPDARALSRLLSGD